MSIEDSFVYNYKSAEEKHEKEKKGFGKSDETTTYAGCNIGTTAIWWQKTMEPSTLENQSNVIDTKRIFESGSQRDDDSNKPLVNHLTAYLRLRFGYLLRAGANKYGKNNWQKGQPTETALESLHRHLAKYELGDRNEDHLSAIIFNVQLIMQNEEKEGIKINEYYKEK
jgi:hypothetical protein